MANPTLRELGTFLGQFVPGAGVADAAGYYPASDKGYNPSLSDNWKAGNYGAASLQALGALADVIPGAGAGAKMSLAALGAVPALKTAAKVADAAAPEAKGIIAYHGSPHSFDRFDLSKIGTGEGAQAYGHGLYFADNEAVARGYRDSLSGKIPAYDRQALVQGNEHLVAAAKMMREGGMDAEAIRATMASSYKRATPEQIDAALKSSDPGHMYQVRINADPEHFLDWDRPLSEHPEIVRLRLGWTPEAEAQYRSAQSADDDALLAALEDRGNYSASRIPVPAGLPPLSATGEDIVRGRSVFDRASDVEKANRLREAGIPGLKYLDQGSRAAGEGSRNYVVFDDKLIEIMKKYGLAGLGLGLPAFAAMNAQKQQNQTPGL